MVVATGGCGVVTNTATAGGHDLDPFLNEISIQGWIESDRMSLDRFACGSLLGAELPRMCAGIAALNGYPFERFVYMGRLRISGSLPIRSGHHLRARKGYR